MVTEGRWAWPLGRRVRYHFRMAEKKSAPKKPSSKVKVTGKTIKDLSMKPGKSGAVKGGVRVMGKIVP